MSASELERIVDIKRIFMSCLVPLVLVGCSKGIGENGASSDASAVDNNLCALMICDVEDEALLDPLLLLAALADPDDDELELAPADSDATAEGSGGSGSVRI